MTVITTMLLAVALSQAPPIPPESKQFDFWIGEWSCVGESIAPDGKKTPTKASNSIKRTLDGRVVEENFRMGNYRGMSVSVYDAKSKLWRQTWVDNGGGYIALTGTFKNGRMVLNTIPRPDQPKGGNRMVFYNIKPDSFTWDWEETRDGGKTWKLKWRLNYKRAKPSARLMDSRQRIDDILESLRMPWPLA